VTNPASTVLTVAFSKFLVKLPNSTLLSNLALCCKPLVQAKIDEMGFVDVSFPFWYSLKMFILELISKTRLDKLITFTGNVLLQYREQARSLSSSHRATLDCVSSNPWNQNLDRQHQKAHLRRNSSRPKGNHRKISSPELPYRQ
jgi:hypothetical protein